MTQVTLRSFLFFTTKKETHNVSSRFSLGSRWRKFQTNTWRGFQNKGGYLLITYLNFFLKLSPVWVSNLSKENYAKRQTFLPTRPFNPNSRPQKAEDLKKYWRFGRTSHWRFFSFSSPLLSESCIVFEQSGKGSFVYLTLPQLWLEKISPPLSILSLSLSVCW